MVARRRPAPPAAAPASDPKRLLLIGVLLLAAVALVFGHALRCEFVAWDDDINVTENPYLNPATWAGLAFFWKAPYLKLYIPLTYSVWAAAAWLSRWRAAGAGLSAPIFHALNVACHAASALCAFALFRSLLRAPSPGRPQPDAGPAATDWAAAAGAAVFALHPVQVEPVAWVSGLRDTISGLATVAALWQYAEFASGLDGAKASRRYASATILFVCALLAKPSAVVLPILAALLDRGVLERPWERVVKSLALWFAAAAGFALLTRSSQDATHIRALMPLWSRPLVALDSLAFYLQKLAWPAALSPDYGRPPDLVLSKGWLYWTWAAPAGLAVLIALAPGRRINAVCAGLFAAAPLPVLGLVPFLHQDLSTVADRYVYASFLGPGLACAWHLRATTRRWVWGAAAALIAALGARAAVQARVWSNTGTLFTNVLAYTDSAIAHGNLANYLADHGDLVGAEHHYREALRLRPSEGMPLNNLGNFLARHGRAAEALPLFEKALADGVPNNVIEAHNALGVVLWQQGKTAEAERHFAAALALDAGRERIRANLGRLLLAEGKLDAAVSQFQMALQSRPDFAPARRDLGATLARLGRADDARRETGAALGLAPDDAEVNAALGDALQVQGDYAKALPYYQAIVAKAPDHAAAHNSLGYALERLSRLDEARRQYEDAVRLDARLGAAQFNLGSLLLRQGRAGEAAASLEKAVRANPGDAELLHNLGVALLKSGRRKDAEERFQEALRARPGFEPSRRALAEIAAGGAR